MTWNAPIAVCVLLAAAGCAVVGGVPGGGQSAVPAGRALEAARDHRRQAESEWRVGRFAHARQSLERACALWPGDVQAHRLRQDLRIGRGELAAVLAEARAETRVRNDALSWYLLGRLLPAGEPQRRAFRRASERDPRFGWGHYGLGVVQFRRRQLSAAAAGLRLARDRFSLEQEPEAREQTTLMLARVHDALLDRAGAEAMLAQAEAEFPASAGAWLVRAALADRDGEVKSAFALAERALPVPEAASAAASRLEGLLRIHGTPADFARVRTLVGVPPAGAPARLHRLAGRVALETGEWAEAQAAYAHALRLGVAPSEVAAERRLLAVRQGRPAEAMVAERTLVPATMALAPHNRRRDRFLRLEAAVKGWAEAPADPAAAVEFADAALRAGWIEEGRTVAARVADAESTTVAERGRAVALLRKLEGYDALVARLRESLDAGYRAARVGEAPVELEPFIQEMGRWAKANLAAPWNRDLSAGTRYIRFSLIGELIDPVPPPPDTPPSAICGLQRYFLEEWNHHLLLGRRNGQPPEATLLRVASWNPGAQRTLWGRPVTFGVLHGEARALESLREHQGAEIAGAAFSAGFYIELTAAGRAASALAKLHELDAATRARLSRVVAPPAEDAGSALALFSDPALRAALVLRGGSGGDAVARERDAVEWHELAHVVDARRMLPLTKNPADVLRWLARAQFSLRRAESRLEEHAYWAALAHAQDPHVVLAELIAFLPEENSSPPHSHAAYQLLDTLCRWAWRHGGVDRRRVILHQFLEWPPERLREAARICAVRRGFEAAGPRRSD